MSVKLIVLVVAVLLTALTVVKSQSSEPAPAEPSFEELVKQHEARTLYVVNVLVASSQAPQELKAVVLANAQQELAACVQQASVDGNRGVFFACTSTVIKNAANALNASASSGASAVN